ncbi:MAG: ATP-binding cassette domain-containing protein [Kiritimatiellae bacterium]|nr:ATP-binding cassette domain-containing protein [Kiritimatiellia bacterium]MDW8459068.1 ATP-binding cassette domain-containing protein [Verrucomicrobiota bacterium]
MIKVDKLLKRFGPHEAVRGVTFEVRPGDILGFLGPNGAGKTTTMRMITGYLTPTSGSAWVNGFNVAEQPIEARRAIGYLPENAPSYGDMTVEEFLRFIAAMRGFYGASARRRVDETIEKCMLANVRRQPIDTLSKGYRQRTCFAQAILHDPPCLILDEPTEGLDPNQKHVVRTMIRNMAQQKTVIFSTHILEEVEAICTRVIIISDGRIVADSTPSELRQQGTLDEVFRRLTTTADVAEVSR